MLRPRATQDKLLLRKVITDKISLIKVSDIVAKRSSLKRSLVAEERVGLSCPCRHTILSRACLPFHHSATKLIAKF